MKLATLATALLLAIPLTSGATCIGTGTLQNCYDNSGNSYTVQRMGNMTTVQGYNANTGNSWNQTSNTYGNMTQTYGTASNGNSWNETTLRSPGMTRQYGTDSRGRSFSRTCTTFGCN